MSFSAQTFSALEQPSLSKWNQLNDNDNALRDGSGIANNAIAARSLATNAILLGYAERTTDFASTSTSIVDVTGLEVAVTVPSGGRSVLLVAKLGALRSTASAGTSLSLYLREGSSTLDSVYKQVFTNGDGSMSIQTYISAPSAGSHTYKVSIQQGAAGTITAGAAASVKSTIMAFLM
jgi:hypothetical protein